MRLTVLHEMAVSTGAVAVGPMTAIGTRQSTISKKPKRTEVFPGKGDKWYLAPWMTKREDDETKTSS